MLRSSVLRIAAAAASLASVSTGFAQLTAEPFLGASNYSLIVKGNATFAGSHVALGGLIGGNLVMQSGANMEFGNRLSNGFALHVGGNVQQLGGGQIALFNNDYYFASGSGGATLQNPGSALAVSPIGASINSIFASLEQRAGDFLNASSFGAVNATSLVAGNKLTLTVQPGELNVFTVDASLAGLLADQNAEVHVAGLLDGNTRLIVNYVGGGDASALDFRAKTLGLSGTTYDQVIWNFAAVGTVNFFGDTFHGSIFAPTSSIVWSANDLDGQLVAATYTSLVQREIHDPIFWTEPPPLTPIPEPSTYALAGALLLVGVVGLRRWRARAPLVV